MCVGGYALENLTSHTLLTTARGSNVCGGRGGPSRLSSDQLCLCKTEETEGLLNNMFSFYIVQNVLYLHFTRNVKSTQIH